MSRSSTRSSLNAESRLNKRQSAVERIAAAQLAAMGGTLADTIGDNNRQRLLWLGLLASPLLFPVALPGMATGVGALCVVVALGLLLSRPIQLPRWLGKLELNARVKVALAAMVNRSLRVIARLGRPRWLLLSNRPARLFNGSMLAVAGLSMAMPVPLISFDNVLPALAIVLISWGLRLRDGWMLLAGYMATGTAVASVGLLWWGGSVAAGEVWSWVWR